MGGGQSSRAIFQPSISGFIRRLKEGILATISTDGYPAIPANLTAIKEVYKESVRQIVYSALTQYQTQPHDISLPFLFELTAPELQQLNQTGQVTIDISSRIAGQPNEQNCHIVNVGVDFMGVQATGPIPSGAARLRTVLEPYAGKIRYANHGDPVVPGQRMLQSASDIVLGWTRDDEGHDYY